MDQTLHRVATKEREEIKRTTKQEMARRHNKEGGNHLDQQSNRQKTMEDNDGGLYPVVAGQSLDERRKTSEGKEDPETAYQSGRGATEVSFLFCYLIFCGCLFLFVCLSFVWFGSVWFVVCFGLVWFWFVCCCCCFSVRGQVAVSARYSITEGDRETFLTTCCSGRNDRVK